jgi:DNA-binding PadR family transcriptional regulator
MLADQSQTRLRLTVLPSEKENGMGAMERKNLELIRAHLRSLERKGFVVSSLDPDGQVRWRITEKGRREDPNEMDSRLDLDS